MASVICTTLSFRVEHQPEGTKYLVDLVGLPAHVRGPRRLYWTVWGQENLDAPPVLDGFVTGVLLQVAVAGGELRVRGAMTRTRLLNATRLLELRRATSPDRYQPLRVIPDAVIDFDPPETADPRSAVLAFSGGLDSTHAAIRHAKLGGEDALNLKALVMVFGFDAPLNRPDVFKRMLERAKPLAAVLHLPLIAVETNSMLLARSLWPQTAAPLAAVALSLFWQTARAGIFGGGLPYGANFLPLGHQPLFDQCCSGDAFTLVTDAAGLSRAQKLAVIVAEPAALSGLRVCWKGSDVSKNCGRCEKCLQTQMNLRTARIEAPGLFETPFDLDQLRRSVPRTLYDARDLAEYCWRDVRDDPAMTAEAQVVGALLATPPPDPVAATVALAATRFVPRPIAEPAYATLLRGQRLARAAKRRARILISRVR